MVSSPLGAEWKCGSSSPVRCCTLSHAAAHCASQPGSRVSLVDPHGFCRVGWAVALVVALAVAFRKLAPGWLRLSALGHPTRRSAPAPDGADAVRKGLGLGGSLGCRVQQGSEAAPLRKKAPWFRSAVQSRVQCVPT